LSRFLYSPWSRMMRPALLSFADPIDAANKATEAPILWRRRLVAALALPHASLQRLEAIEMGPLLPLRLGLRPFEAPKALTARLRVVATAGAMPAASLVGADAERPQQIALRAPDQIDACLQWARQPLFEREPSRKASLAYGSGSSPRHAPVSSPRHHRA
jgi:hypothetical protein